MANTTYDIKLKFAIKVPSEIFGNTANDEYALAQIERFSTTENMVQTPINTIEEAHTGFATAVGDFTGTFSIYETSDALVLLDEIISKNLYFDIVLAEKSDAQDTSMGGEHSPWKVEQSLIIGCKITRRERSYEYGRIPLRVYGFSYLKVKDSEMNANGDTYVPAFGNGLFNVSIETGTPAASGGEREIKTQGS